MVDVSPEWGWSVCDVVFHIPTQAVPVKRNSAPSPLAVIWCDMIGFWRCVCDKPLFDVGVHSPQSGTIRHTWLARLRTQAPLAECLAVDISGLCLGWQRHC